ncbi:hypothetical protein GOODEAATRI_030151, partial [Goodea atripinnis]
LAESMASSTEPAWLRQPLDNNEHKSSKKKQTIPKPGLSSPPPDRNFNVSPVVVDLDQSGSGGEEPHQNLSNEVIDLSAETSTELIGIGRFVPQLQISSDEKSDGPNRTSPSETNFNHITVPQNRRDSDLQQPESCSKAELSRLSPELEASHGSFNLELEDSNDVLDAADTEEEEQKLLSELLINGSFDVNKSLSESRSRRTISSCRASNVDESINESIVTTKKKRAAVIYDSDEEEELRSPLSHSFQVLGSSTPKLSPPGSSTRRSRKIVGGNTSVVSHRSLLQSVIEDIDDQDVQDEDENDEDNGENFSEVDSEPGETLHSEEEEEEVDNSAEDMKFNLEEEEDGGMETEDEEDHDVSDQLSAAGEDSRVGSTRDELQLEETSREEEGMKDHTESTNVASSEDLSSSLEELSSEPELTSGEPELTSGEPELTSGEQMDQCAAKSIMESDSYESLVQRGKECYSQARLDDALSFFLRAIDIQPGDSEVQFMTIQLYRQLSQNR